MGKVGIISVDGHVKAARRGYREYLDAEFRDDYDALVASDEDKGIPDTGNIHPDFPVEAQWDSRTRLAELERVGVVAEVVFPNGMPFQVNRLEDFGRAQDPRRTRAGMAAYNRWLADFCAEAPGRRFGNTLVSFGDVERAVDDIRWAKDHGLDGVMLPALRPGGRLFFDPALDPIWAVCHELGMPLSQHGGAGIEPYTPPGFAAIMTLAVESGFFSIRSLWQMILGGVFERFPDLQVTYVETQVVFMRPAIERIDNTLQTSDDWMDFARSIGRDRPFSGLASEFFESNCHVGLSPFTSKQIPFDDLAGVSESGAPLDGWHIGADKTMFGLDFPHFESHYCVVDDEVRALLASPCFSADDVERLLFRNAAEVYGFDLDALAPDIERVGVDLDDLATRV
jgi:predicted TIM-barrel fold metal-dependent hydrolase